MAHNAILMGRTGLFTRSFREMVAECGFELAEADDESFDVAAADDRLPIIALEVEGDLEMVRPHGARPFVVFTPEPLQPSSLQPMRDNGLQGALTPGSSPEDVAFLLNRAAFYDKMVKRNPRAPVDLPVVLTYGSRVINTFASLLSRDGMFVVTLNPLDVNALCTLRFSLPGNGAELTTGARVLYRVAINKDLNIIANPRDPFKRMVSHPGMAVFFTDLDHGHRESIDRYIEKII